MAKAYQIVVTSGEVNDIEAALEALQELQAQYPSLKVELYETKTIQ